MPEQEVKVSRIVLKVGGTEISLSLQEAEDLYSVLNQIFNKQIIFPPYTPQQPIYIPVYVERLPVLPSYPFITCGQTTQDGTSTLYLSTGEANK